MGCRVGSTTYIALPKFDWFICLWSGSILDRQMTTSSFPPVYERLTVLRAVCHRESKLQSQHFHPGRRSSPAYTDLPQITQLLTHRGQLSTKIYPYGARLDGELGVDRSQAFSCSTPGRSYVGFDRVRTAAE